VTCPTTLLGIARGALVATRVPAWCAAASCGSIRGVRVYTRYRRSAGRERAVNGLYWALALAGMVFVGWIFWRAWRDAHRPVAPAGTPPALGVNPYAARSSTPTNAVAGPTLALAPPAPPPESVAPVTSAPYALTGAGEAMLVGPAAQLTLSPGEVLEAQIALARRGISSGSLDGVMGGQTRAAIRAFQSQAGLRVTGALDAATRARLVPDAPPLVAYVITADDWARLRPVSATWLGKSQQDRLDYESVLELVAEKHHSHPGLIRRLNPTIDWEQVRVGTVAQVPNAVYPAPRARAALIRIYLAERLLEAVDAQGRLLSQFPCSIARYVTKRPVGRLYVSVVVAHPDYTFDPAVFPESVEGRQLGRKLRLPPGPNNPVGTAWIGLDRPRYGIHGTPEPEAVGRTESHGCFRLANWNAEYLAQLVSPGTPVHVQP